MKVQIFDQNHGLIPWDWKQQDMVIKSTQTQYGGKFDGQFHKKRPKKGKKQRGYTTERFMPRNDVIMLIF